MLYFAILFLIVALAAGALGFGFVAVAALHMITPHIAKMCFYIFLALFLVSLFGGLNRRSRI